jgi:hypothetical protein
VDSCAARDFIIHDLLQRAYFLETGKTAVKVSERPGYTVKIPARADVFAVDGLQRQLSDLWDASEYGVNQVVSTQARFSMRGTGLGDSESESGPATLHVKLTDPGMLSIRTAISFIIQSKNNFITKLFSLTTPLPLVKIGFASGTSGQAIP